ncbi:MAG: type II toxin-antitoxin system Phd/YefM family antitoxin [Clostridiales bacterium]|nr:type II toxin-antitoxin system Phd/YefM family antitoxin [Clostridiales bacterium]MBS5877835.1 type II toxin-antitoxin system Phd/YefM family antitoxin [Clostridiales bacterium]
MIALKTSDIRNDFKKISNLVIEGEKILISRPRNENLVILSEREYNELEKMRIKNEYLTKLDKSFEQFSQEKTVVKTIEELEDMAR